MTQVCSRTILALCVIAAPLLVRSAYAEELCDDGTKTTVKGTISKIEAHPEHKVWFLWPDENDEQAECLYSAIALESKPPASCKAGAKFFLSGTISIPPNAEDVEAVTLDVDKIECGGGGSKQGVENAVTDNCSSLISEYNRLSDDYLSLSLDSSEPCSEAFLSSIEKHREILRSRDALFAQIKGRGCRAKGGNAPGELDQQASEIEKIAASIREECKALGDSGSSSAAPPSSPSE